MHFAKRKSTADLENLTPEQAEVLRAELWGNQAGDIARTIVSSESNEWYTPAKYIEAARIADPKVVDPTGKLLRAQQGVAGTFSLCFGGFALSTGKNEGEIVGTHCLSMRPAHPGATLTRSRAVLRQHCAGSPGRIA